MSYYINLVTVMSLKNVILVLRKNICGPYAKRIQGSVVMHTSQISSIRKTLKSACKSACSAKTGLELDRCPEPM